jgi:hypothetical protein
MSPNASLNQLAAHVNGLDRDGCIAALHSFKSIRLDFSEKYLADASLERLRHILLAAYITAQRAKKEPTGSMK